MKISAIAIAIAFFFTLTASVVSSMLKLILDKKDDIL